MPRKSGSGGANWVDPDDAPELTDEFFENAVWELNGQPWTPPGRAAASARQVELRLLVDEKVADHFRTSEPGWEARVNTVLKKAALKTPARA